MKALRRAGWAVSVVPEWEYIPLKWGAFSMRALGRLIRPVAVREFNKALISEVCQSRADMFLSFKGMFVTAEAVKVIRAQGCFAYCFFPDNSFFAHGPWLPHALPEYDWVYSAKSFGLRDLREQLGMERTSLLLHGFDPDLHRPLELTPADLDEFEADVSFIGTWSPKKERYLAVLATSRPDLRLRIWGAYWDKARSQPLKKVVRAARPLLGDSYVRAICASKINLGILSERRKRSSADDQITSRTFHIPASGGFLLHERTPEVLNVLKENVEIGCFGDEEEIVAAVEHWLEQPSQRVAVAEAGYQAVVASHSWDQRIGVILRDHAHRRDRVV
ncbi:MAG: hypothetical protein C4576_31300 [Desulfobacteraceae bacterium]|nr:MAG: hypothetical protein C4576_31300 [Desulfobacteraceae bacterium]